MKINFGKLKRKILVVGDNTKMRPTQSSAKSIMFNVLDITESDTVADLFAGTGALGFEAASLGAGKVFWSDNNIHSVKAIQQNINNFGLDPKNFRVFKTDFRMVLKKLPFKPTIIFLDPPFIATKYYDEALDFIIDNDVLADGGVIVMEKPFKVDINSLSRFSSIDKRRMGDKDLMFLRI